jgi:hypothetical protein
MNSIPDRITGWLQPAAKTVLKFKQVSGTAFRTCLSANGSFTQGASTVQWTMLWILYILYAYALMPS